MRQNWNGYQTRIRIVILLPASLNQNLPLALSSDGAAGFHLVIDYIPDQWMVESKSFKLYLNSFRNHQAFHEACTIDIGKELVELLAR